MQLKHIKYGLCECGAETVAERIRGFHSNGQGFEEREFECGSAFAWSPNLMQLEQRRACPHNVDSKARGKNLDEAKAAALASLEHILPRLSEDDGSKIIGAIVRVFDNMKTWGHP